MRDWTIGFIYGRCGFARVTADPPRGRMFELRELPREGRVRLVEQGLTLINGNLHVNHLEVLTHLLFTSAERDDAERRLLAKIAAKPKVWERCHKLLNEILRQEKMYNLMSTKYATNSQAMTIVDMQLGGNVTCSPFADDSDLIVKWANDVPYYG